MMLLEPVRLVQTLPVILIASPIPMPAPLSNNTVYLLINVALILVRVTQIVRTPIFTVIPIILANQPAMQMPSVLGQLPTVSRILVLPPIAY